MVYIYTENLFFSGKIKNFIKTCLGRESRGPQAVLSSLNAGLKELGIDFVPNKKTTQPIDVACVISGVKTLKWAIRQKNLGKIKKIIAGPNLVVVPSESGGILKSKAIDVIVVPSQWVMDFYIKEAPELTEKIKIWAAGVTDKGSFVDHKGNILIFYKSGNFDLTQKAYEFSQKKGIKAEILIYGKFDHNQYVNLLKNARLMVYISESESQGLALNEAWMAGVPTLVWDREKFEYKAYSLLRPHIGAPYLNPECGLFFKSAHDLEKQFDNLLNNYNNFKPREYSLKNFTNKISAGKYLEIIK